jgi:hypothetical protein
MTSKVIFLMAVRCGFVLTVLMTSYACGNEPKLQNDKSHNLKFVQCDADVPVPVIKATGTVSSVDQVIFVCVGNKVQWFTDDANFTFDVVFDPASNADDLFDPVKPPFHSKPDPTGKHQHASDVLTVSNKAKSLKDYPYTIQATDKTGKPVAASDPHVIPM